MLMSWERQRESRRQCCWRPSRRVFQGPSQTRLDACPSGCGFLTSKYASFHLFRLKVVNQKFYIIRVYPSLEAVQHRPDPRLRIKGLSALATEKVLAYVSLEIAPGGESAFLPKVTCLVATALISWCRNIKSPPPFPEVGKNPEGPFLL